ncbi:MAG: tRNA-dihydrouridine synthase family protein [Bacteroides sp.]|nr:tRNA-dihydrouridine synthase family protein [Bacteroides sp.]
MTIDKDFRLLCAPLQGFTEAAFRHFHAQLYPAIESVTYYTPFIRIEKGEIRSRDMREVCSTLNTNHHLIPQIIFKDTTEFSKLTEELYGNGYREIDLNMGCPFVPQVRKGRGAGIIGNPAVFKDICGIIRSMPEIRFSIKMRVGISAPDEWRALIADINSTPLCHVTIHPRTASQQYGGELHYDQFEEMLHTFEHPVVFNGDIENPDQIGQLRERYPELSGVMIGRGLLKRPSIIAEWIENREWSRSEHIAKILTLHSMIADNYRSTLTGGDTQILSKIKPLWEYFGEEFDRRTVKKIMKASTLSKYDEAVRNLR